MDRFRLPEPSAELIAELGRLAVDRRHAEQEARRLADARALRSSCGRRIPAMDFVSYYGAATTEQFVRGTLVPEPARDATITDGELEELIRRILAGECPDDHYGYWLRLLEVNIPNPNIGTLLEQHPDASPSELLRRAREYAPIRL